MLDNSLRRIPQFNDSGIRLLLIIAPPILALIAAFLFSWPTSLYVLLALGALAGAWILLRWPILGIIILIVSVSTLPFLINTGTKTSLNLSVILVPTLLGLWVFDLIARKRGFPLYMTPAVLAALGLALTAFLSFVIGQLPWFALSPAPLTAQLGGLAVFLFSVGAFLLAVHHIEERVWLERVVWLLIIAAALQMVSVMMPNVLPFRRFFHPLNSSLTLTWLITLAFSVALFNRKLRLFWRVFLILVVMLAFYLTFFRLRSWASGWMPGMVSLVVILMAWKPRLGIVLGIICGGIGLYYMRDLIGVLIVEDNFYSLDTRLAAWKVLIEMIDVNPFLGLGPANYYWYTPLYSILGYNVEFNSHNQFVDIIAQTGLIGLAFFGWWAAALARLAWRLRSRAVVGFEQAFVFGAFGGLAGTLFAGMLGDWILPFVYNVGLAGFRGSVVAWLMLGGLVALDRMYQKEAEEEPAAAPAES